MTGAETEGIPNSDTLPRPSGRRSLRASQAMRAYRDYITRLDRGAFAAERRK
jgi:hypothetical protein